MMRRNRKNSERDNAVKVILLLTAIANLITALVNLIGRLFR